VLESYFELLCTSLLFVMPAGIIALCVNYTLICAGIMTLNHHDYKITNVIRYGTIRIKISVELSWNYNWNVFTVGLMYTRLA